MKKLMSLIAVFGMLSGLMAQSGSISGTVTDQDGNALPGANVAVDGTSLGAAADGRGAYSISGVAAGTYTLSVSYIGYESASQSVTVSAEASTQANFSLATSALAGADVFVTGTRAAGRTAMKSPTPIDGFDDMTLRRQGNGDFTETLKNIVPSFNATPLTGDGAAFVRPTSMRGLPPDNILVMTNSKRRHRSALISHFGAAMNVGAQAVDVGMIPSIAIKKLEVLRDGAAAQYGSDAIAGVMNFILKDNSSGYEVQLTGGRWMEAPNGRGGETDVTIAANIGLPLTDDGFVNLSFEYSDRPELSRGFQHASASDGYKGWDAEGFTKDDEWGYVGEGTDNTDEWQTAMNWGRPESNGFRSVWNAGLKISDNVEAYSFGNYADTFGEYSFFLRAAGKSGALTAIPLDPTDPSKGDFSWGDTYPLGFTPRLEGHGNDLSSVVGIKGDDLFGLGYDFSASYGKNHIRYYLKNTLNLSWGPYSPHNFDIGDLEQAETNLNADFTYALSEAINLAFGTEWRKESYTMFQGQKESWMAGPWATVHTLTYDSAGTGNMVNYGYTAPGSAANGMPGTSPDAAGVFDRTNTAFYADVEYAMGDALLLQFAARSENFSDFGSTSNIKVAGRYSISDLLTLRGGYSTGFRAPTPGQSNYTGIVTSFDGVTGLQVQEGTVKPTDALAAQYGGKELGPENSVNTSFGFTSNPIDNLSLTFDMYQIDIEGKILKSRSISVDDPNFSELAFYTNALDTKTSGYDLVAVYRMGNTNLSLAMNHNETEVVKQNQVNGQNPVSDGNVQNLEENLPKDRITATVTQDFGEALSLMVRLNNYGESVDERSQKDVIDPITFIDVELSYAVSNNLNVVFGANNVTNAYPNKISTRASQGMPYPRRSPLGYHGGFSYLKLLYNF
ncbi:MAG: TonB-dependent receptor domain-containing protein [Fidelibacterota bacterium]